MGKPGMDCLDYKEFLQRLDLIDCEIAKLMYSLYLNFITETKKTYERGENITKDLNWRQHDG